MADDDNIKAQKLREDGNAFYKEGEFILGQFARIHVENLLIGSRILECLLYCMEADPTDPAPCANLSAVRYEMGAFHSSITTSTKALALYNESDQAKKQRLFTRIAKSNIYSLKLQDENWKTVPEDVSSE